LAWNKNILFIPSPFLPTKSFAQPENAKQKYTDMVKRKEKQTKFTRILKIEAKIK
jgi:hypothetical protein